MLRADSKTNSILYAIVFTVVAVSLSVHLTAFVYSHVGPLSVTGYILLSTGIAFLLVPACSFFLAKYTVNLIDLQKRVEEYVTTDALTCCLNRQAFFNVVETEQRRMRRSRKPAAIMLLDLDHFRILNHRYGHEAGDSVLQELSKMISSDLRDGSDFLARWGGEEFVIMMAETSIDDALQVAERIRASVEASTFTHRGENMKVTISIGITDLHWAECLKHALDRADARMIEAKVHGRNWIETTEPTQTPFLIARQH